MTHEDDIRQQAAILVRMYQELCREFQSNLLRITRHKKEHGEFPEDTKEVFQGIRDRGKRILAAMKELRERDADKTVTEDAFANVVVPDFLPENLT